MAKRPPSNRRRRPRPTGVFWSGQGRAPVPDSERARLTLYLSPAHFDLAEILASKEGAISIQRYCEGLLEEALDAEKSRTQVDVTEKKRGPLEGLRAIADDPAYLAEWNASTVGAKTSPDEPEPEPGPFRLELESYPIPVRRAALPMTSNSPAAQAVLAHAGDGSSEVGSFLGYLRRGENPPENVVADLVEALANVDTDLAGSRGIDRRLAYALHRLAFESQVLLTDAFPNAFDGSTVHTLRAIQEAVDRILSGEDIRYLES